MRKVISVCLVGAAIVGVSAACSSTPKKSEPTFTVTAAPSAVAAASATAHNGSWPVVDACELLSEGEVQSVMTTTNVTSVPDEQRRVSDSYWLKPCTWAGGAPEAPRPTDGTPCSFTPEPTVTLTLRGQPQTEAELADYFKTISAGGIFYSIYKGFQVSELDSLAGTTAGPLTIERARFGYRGPEALSSRGCVGRGAEGQINIVLRSPGVSDGSRDLLLLDVESWSGGNVLDSPASMQAALQSLATLALSRIR